MDGFAFDVEVIRTGRTKSASIQLDGDKIKVSVPNRLSDTRVRELINKKSSWIEVKLKEQSIRKTIKPKEYVSGEIFTYNFVNSLRSLDSLSLSPHTKSPHQQGLLVFSGGGDIK